jgi:lipopolysaccharide transport system ATP-binding protein
MQATGAGPASRAAGGAAGAAPPAPVVAVSGLTKRFQIYERPADRLLQALARGRRRYARDFQALTDVSLDVYRGETVGLIGPNGAGKSTLLKILCGTVEPSSGRVEVRGRVAALLELGAGFNGEFTGRENVIMSAHLHGMSRAAIEQRLPSIEAFAEIGEFFDRPVKSYSSGMYVRLGFALIAHLDADVLIVDEALAVGDAYFVQKCMRFIRGFQQHGTLIFVSHDSAAVVSLCHRAVWLDGGRVRAVGPAKDVCQLYLGDAIQRLQGDSLATPSAARANVPEARQQLGSPSAARASATAAQQPPGTSSAALPAAGGGPNRLEGFRFEPDSPAFGKGGARVVDVRLLDPAGRALAAVEGGEVVTLSITARLLEPMQRPILGFIVKDRLGQNLFSENTCKRYTDSPCPAAAGELINARFTFRMPILPVGDYSVAIAVADGDQWSNVQHHWLHDAMIFKSITSSVSTGLVGIPMLDVVMSALPAG